MIDKNVSLNYIYSPKLTKNPLSVEYVIGMPRNGNTGKTD